MNIDNKTKLRIYKYSLKISKNILNETYIHASIYYILMESLKYYNININFFDVYKFNKLKEYFPEIAVQIIKINKINSDNIKNNQLHIENNSIKIEIIKNAINELTNKC